MTVCTYSTCVRKLGKQHAIERESEFRLAGKKTFLYFYAHFLYEGSGFIQENLLGL